MEWLPGVFPLIGVVQHYSWGGFDYIPELLNRENKEHQPYAEYWLGAHPNHPAFLEDGQRLSVIIDRDPEKILGKKHATKFGSLPYLLKVLDVRQMLSIQVHPDKASAEKAFEAENKKGIPVNAAHRNYKDRNHKPELMVALGDFWLLHGFKNENALESILDLTPELRFLTPSFKSGGYQKLYEQVMQMPQPEVNQHLQPLVDRVVPLYEKNALQKDREDFWAARAALNFCRDNNWDRGIFSIYFFNLLHLKKGEGIFQPAGMPHAYLEGQNVEVMANSDNVLRAGLTDKHIDVNELMKHVRFEATEPRVLGAQSGKTHKVFNSPAEEFELHQYLLAKEQRQFIKADAPEILLLIEGAVEMGGKQLSKGTAVFLLPGHGVEILVRETTTLFRVTVPDGVKN
jgi:mannose-6-phosphate isomerase